MIAPVRWRRLVLRDVTAAAGQGAVTLPILFYLLVATLTPFAIGSDRLLLARIGAGTLWIAALLAALLPIERLVNPDLADGTIDQLVVRGLSEEGIAAAKLLAHWLGFAPPLLLATIPAAALLGLGMDRLALLEAGLLLGTPGLAALGLVTAALTAGLRGAGGLAGLVMLPLAVPVLIFGAGMLADGGGGAATLLGATSLLLVAAAPFAAGAAIRAGRG